MHLGQHVVDNRSMEDIYGYGTLVWIERIEDDIGGDTRTLWVCKFNGGSLEILKTSDGVIGASTADSLLNSAYIGGYDELNNSDVTYLYSIKDTQIYKVPSDTQDITYCGIYKFGARNEIKKSISRGFISNPFEPGSTNYSGGNSYISRRLKEKECLICGVGINPNISSTDGVVCDRCWASIKLNVADYEWIGLV